MRACISLAVIAFALAGSVGSAGAQYYPPPPPQGYQAYPLPPPPPPYAPQTYTSAPLPPPDAAAPPDANAGPYGGYAQPADPGQEQSEAYPPPPPNQPYVAPDSRFPPQPLPPGAHPDFVRRQSVSGGPEAPDITGAVQSPGVAAGRPPSDPTVDRRASAGRSARTGPAAGTAATVSAPTCRLPDH